MDQNWIAKLNEKMTAKELYKDEAGALVTHYMQMRGTRFEKYYAEGKALAIKYGLISEDEDENIFI